MAKQVWGTFSVKDHCRPGAFVAEMILYDRLVLPVPPDDAARSVWSSRGWNPDLQDKLLEVMGERVRRVPWDEERQKAWKDRLEFTLDVADKTSDVAFQLTRFVLTAGLPGHVTGVQAVANYTSLEDLERDLLFRPALRRPNAFDDSHSAGLFTAILGHEFLYPYDPRMSHEQLLKEAVDWSNEPAFTRKRAAFWRWQREFLNDKGIADAQAIRDAVEEMRDTLTEARRITLKGGALTASRYAFLVGTVSLGFAGANSTALMAVAAGSAFLSVGQFVAERLLATRDRNETAVSLLHDTQRHFGWTDR